MSSRSVASVRTVSTNLSAYALTIPLDVDSAAIADLRSGIREILSGGARRQPRPTLKLDKPLPDARSAAEACT
jgi:hypothetical protein